MTVDGKYRITLESPLARQNATLEFVSHGSKLSGMLTGSMGTLEFSDGKVDGAKVTWTMNGLITASYTHTATWQCTGAIDGNAINGEMNVSGLGTFPFRGSKMGREGEHDAAEPALKWRDMGLPRYEALSVAWVNALKAYVKEKTKGKTCDFELTWSVEYTNPPAHLLRGDGRDFIGYHFRAKDGKFEVCDDPLESADMRVRYPYYPVAVKLRMSTDEYVAYVREHGAEFRDQVKTIGGGVEMGRRVNEFLGGAGNDIREEFLSQQTA